MPEHRYTPGMAIPTEPIGSLPRPPQLIQAIASFAANKITRDALEEAYSEALRDTIDRLEQTGSPVLTDGEQTKPSFATYPLTGLRNLAPDGVVIPFCRRSPTPVTPIDRWTIPLRCPCRQLSEGCPYLHATSCETGSYLRFCSQSSLSSR